jgi:hypothetical protein
MAQPRIDAHTVSRSTLSHPGTFWVQRSAAALEADFRGLASESRSWAGHESLASR